jgi:hypothetical protein
VCGAFHTGESLDICQQCSILLNSSNSEHLTNLFEMTTVATQRVERITCDEEERVRKGYNITTHFRFSKNRGKQDSAVVADKSGNPLLNLEFGPASEIWRINRRWLKSQENGFFFDESLGIWNKKQGDTEDTALDAGKNTVKNGVMIFVKDTRNIMLIRAVQENPLTDEDLANLQHAMHKGLCAVFQIDYNEIASERIGQNEHRSILFWEAAEGGVGILQRLVAEPGVVKSVAEKAMEVCHFAEQTEKQIDCARACYQCLLTYSNQRDHVILDRHKVKKLLIRLSESTVEPVHEKTRSNDEHYQWLKQQTDNRSKLENEFLDYLYQHKLRLPDTAQKRFADYLCQPDFYYENGCVCVFCDGSVHDDLKQRKEDKRIRDNLVSKGFRVVVIRYDRPMDEQIEAHQGLFGSGLDD